MSARQDDAAVIRQISMLFGSQLEAFVDCPELPAQVRWFLEHASPAELRSTLVAALIGLRRAERECSVGLADSR